MVECLVKAINKNYVVVCYQPLQIMKECLKEKLLTCANKNGGKFEAFFDVIFDSEQDIIELLLLCHETHTIFLGLKQNKKEKTIHLVQNYFHAGECYRLFEDTIVQGNIPHDCFIQTSANLIVLGNTYGCIDFMHQDLSFECLGHIQARIRFFDTFFQNVTSFSSARFYYKNQRIIKEDHR